MHHASWPCHKGFRSARNFLKKIPVVATRRDHLIGFLNASWSCHGSKSFRIGCPTRFRNAVRPLMVSERHRGDCSRQKRLPLYRVRRFRWALRPILYLKNAALFMAAAMGAVAHVQGSFSGHLLRPPSLTNRFQLTVWFPHITSPLPA